ncbi:MAG: hypothetical protein ACRDTA_02595 [Pseudonocardiaceae bacterium]
MVAIGIHSFVSGLFLPFLVIYFIQAGYLSLVSAGAALLVGLATVKLGPAGVRAMRRAVHRRFPVLGDHDNVHELPDHITGPRAGDQDGECRAVRDSKDPFTAAQ